MGETTSTTTTETTATTAATEPAAADTTQTADATKEGGTWRDARGRFVAGSAPVVDMQAADESTQEKPAEAGEETKKDDKYGPRFAALVRTQARLKEQTEALRREQAEWGKERELHAFVREHAPKDPLSVLRRLAEHAGVPFHKLYSEATRQIIADGQPPDPAEVARQTAQEQLEAWKAEQAKAAQEAEQRTRQERLQAEYTQSVGELGRLLESGAYPRSVVPLKGQTRQQRAEQVSQVALHEMAREYAASGRVLDFEEALGRIEEGLEAHFQGQQEALRGTAPQTSTDGGVTPVAAKAAPGDGRTPTGHQETARPKTLAQRLTTEGGPPKPIGWRDRREKFVRSGG